MLALIELNGNLNSFGQLFFFPWAIFPLALGNVLFCVTFIFDHPFDHVLGICCE